MPCASSLYESSLGEFRLTVTAVPSLALAVRFAASNERRELGEGSPVAYTARAHSSSGGPGKRSTQSDLIQTECKVHP